MVSKHITKRRMILAALAMSLLAAGGSIGSESLHLTGKLKTMLPVVTVTHSEEPVSDVKDVTISVSQNAGVCNITSNASQAVKHGSKPICKIEWDDPRGLVSHLNTLNGVVSNPGEHEFAYTLTMYDLDTFEPIQSDTYSVIFSAPILPDVPTLKSNWQIKEETTDTTHELYNRNEEHLTLEAQATERNYDQVVKFGTHSCIINQGQNTCTIEVGEKFDIETVSDVTGSKALDYTITDPYDFISKDPDPFIYEWDFRPPTIVSTHVNTSSDLLPQVISEYGESVVLFHNQAAIVIESPHNTEDPSFYPTDPTLRVRLDDAELYVTDTINYGGIPINFDLGTLYGDQEIDIQPINDPLRIGSYLLYVYDFSHIRDGLYDFTFSTKDGNDNGEESVLQDLYIDRYPPDIQFVINNKHHKVSAKPNVYSLSDITILAWGGWDDGAIITGATLNGEPISFATGTDNVKRLENIDLPINSQHYLSVTAEDATGNEYTKVLDIHYGKFSFTASVENVMQNVQPAKITLRQKTGPFCVISPTVELAQMFSAEFINSRSRGCTVEWMDKPNGLNASIVNVLSRNRMTVAEGIISEVGTQTYHFLVHSHDAFGGSQVVFEGNGEFEVVALSTPELKVGPPQIANNYDTYRHSLAQDRNLSIYAAIKAQPGADLVVELYDESGTLISDTLLEDIGRNARHTFRPFPDLEYLTAYDYKVRVYYASEPQNYTEKPYQFYTVPSSDVRLTLDHPDFVMQGNSIEVLAKMGRRQGDVVTYDSTMGEWEVGFYTYNTSTRDFEALSPPVDTDPSGISRIVITSEQIIAQQNKFFARAKLKTPYPEVNITRRLSALYNVPVLSLGGINASISSNEFISPVPARFVAKIDYESRLDSSTAGDVIWETSPNGTDWTEIDRKRGLNNYLFTFEEPGDTYVRAIVVNRLNGDYNYTNTAHFIAKPLPTIEISGSQSVAIGGIGQFEYMLNEYAQNNSSGLVEYSIDNKLSWNEMAPIESLELHTATNVFIRTLIEPEGEAPYYIYDNQQVSVLPPRSLNLTFRADTTKAEAGDAVDLLARFTANTLYKPQDYRYELILPDGSRHNTLTYSHTLADSDFSGGKASFLFRTWVDGLELATADTKAVFVEQIVYGELPPTELIVQTPERVRFSFVNVRMVKPRQNSIPASVIIEEDILLPSGGELELVNQATNTFRLLANEEGTHPIKVRFYDNRGNERWHTEFVTVTAPPELRFSMKTRHITDNLRPPFRFSNSLSYRFGSPTDRLEKIEWFINSELMFSNRRTIVNQTITEAGEYTITAKITSIYGQTGEVSDTFTIEENKPPVCEPYWEHRHRVKTLFANCKDYDGKVRRVSFVYALNESDEQTTYRFFNPSMSFIEGFYDDRVPIQMTALDDSEGASTIAVSWPEGG